MSFPDNYSENPIWDRFRQIRKSLHITQGQAEKESGISQKDISQLETGKKKFIPKEYIIYLYEKGIDLNWIFGGRGYFMRNQPDQVPARDQTNPSHPMVVEPETIYGAERKMIRLEQENQKLKVENATLMKVIKAISPQASQEDQ